MSILELLEKGGWIMIVLGILSIIAIYIFIERFIAIRAAEKNDPLFMDRIRDYIKSGEVKAAINFCRVTNTPGARIIERGISRMGQPAPEIQTAIELRTPATWRWQPWKSAFTCLPPSPAAHR